MTERNKRTAALLFINIVLIGGAFLANHHWMIWTLVAIVDLVFIIDHFKRKKR
jgi:hypothetical protein